MVHWAVSPDDDIELLGGLEHLVLPAAVEQVVADLIRGDWRIRARFTELIPCEVRDADVEGLAFLTQLLEGAHALLNRRLWIWPVHQKKIQMVGPESLQTLLIDAFERRVTPIK